VGNASHTHYCNALEHCASYSNLGCSRVSAHPSQQCHDIFILPSFIDLSESLEVDLFINTRSFMEMNKVIFDLQFKKCISENIVNSNKNYEIEEFKGE
jgi:hypothetical protein